MRYHNLTAIAVLLVVMPAGCRRFGSQLGVTYVPFTKVTGQEELPSDVTKLNVEIRAGEIRVMAGDPGVVHVEADVKIKEALANPDAEKGGFADHVKISAGGDVLTVADAHTGTPDQSDWRVSLVIRVPPEVALNLYTAAGRIAVEGVTSDIKAKSEAGEIIITSTRPREVSAITAAGKIDIALEGLTGALTANAAAGSVHVAVTKDAPVKDVVLTAGIGDLVLRIPEAATGTFDLRSDVGRVTVSGHPGITVEREALGARGTGTIGQGGPTYKLQASAGAVRLQ